MKEPEKLRKLRIALAAKQRTKVCRDKKKYDRKAAKERPFDLKLK